ncbi:MAG: ATP-binding cassette domain-containing protein [Muribaculaceae bacterium]|nr:ATP-binding cassette domain-containing protein [Muribaculaceae bacterium]
MNVLSIKDLNKRFDKVEALSDVNLEVSSGAILGLLGPNGAGKTTLLRIINGILAKDSGEVLISGEESNLKVARKIGYMPEERGLYDNMTVADQIIFFGQLKGGSQPRLREVMREYLSIFNISDYENRKVKELSKGNQQKVQIIATLVHEPELVILDEPFSGFDPINGALLQELIARLHEKGVTVILSSHNMHAVEEMCDQIALINKGRLLLHEKIEDVKEANKTDELLVTLSSPIDIENFSMSENILSLVPDVSQHGRKGYTYRVKKREGVSNLPLLQELSVGTEILHFEEALPSLNDIFIKYTSSL